MPISRRNVLGLLAGAGITSGLRLFAAATERNPSGVAPAVFEVDRLIRDVVSPSQTRPEAGLRRYRVSAGISLLSIPILTRGGVGSGYTLIEESVDGDSRTVAIQFGAGSFPETAHGLNRLGYIEEVLVEAGAGSPKECAYFAFMTSSPEKDFDQAKKALETSGGTIPYAAARGFGAQGRFVSRLEHLNFSSSLNWADLARLTSQVREGMASENGGERVERNLPAPAQAPSTFLYAVRRAILDQSRQTSSSLVYNGKGYGLRTTKERDPQMGAQLAQRRVTPNAESVMRLSAMLRNEITGHETPFRVWFEAGGEQAPPLRFEYQARSFLKLIFEADPAANGPAVNFALTNKETA